MGIRFHARTDRGRKRPANEDNFIIYHIDADKSATSLDDSQTGARTRSTELAARSSGICFAVADGMGGYNAGEVASAVAVCTLRELLKQYAGSKVTLEQIAAATNDEIHRLATASPGYERMGTTLTLARVTYDEATSDSLIEVVQIGDSRAYLISRNEIQLLTEDQTYVQRLVNHGLLTPARARTHPHRHIILQALGSQATVEPVTTRAIMRGGDVLVLASDGLTEYLSAEEIKHFIHAAQNDLAEASSALIGEANRRGGADNITVVVVEVSGVTVHPAAGTRAYDALFRHAAHAASLAEAKKEITSRQSMAPASRRQAKF